MQPPNTSVAVGATSGSLQTATDHDAKGDLICEVLKHTRLAVDIVVVGINLLLLRIASTSKIRGTNSYRVLANSSVSELLMVGVSVGSYMSQQAHLAADWQVVVATRSQWIFSITSLMCDYVLVINIYYAVTLGPKYKLKATDVKYTAAVILTWVVGIFGGATLTGFVVVQAKYDPRRDVMVVSDLIIIIITVAVPTGVILGLFWKISKSVAQKVSGPALAYLKITSARLAFCRVLMIITFVRVIILVLVIFSNQYFGRYLGLQKDAFRFTNLSLVVYNLIKSIIYIVLINPLKRAAKDLLLGQRKKQLSSNQGPRQRPKHKVEPSLHCVGKNKNNVLTDIKIFSVMPEPVS